MHAGGQTHLILAGDPEITGRIRHALPNDLADKLVDVVTSSERDQQSDALMSLGGIGCPLRYRRPPLP
jgi:hypothetical protein